MEVLTEAAEQDMENELGQYEDGYEYQ